MRISRTSGLIVIPLAVVGLIAQVCLAQHEEASRKDQQLGSSGTMLSVGLLNQKVVREALELTDDQKRKAMQINREMIAQVHASVQTPEYSQKMSQSVNAAMSKLNDVLDEGQQKRLRGIYLQAAGAAAFSDPAIATELKLTEDQKKQVAELGRKNRRARSELEEAELAKGSSPQEIGDKTDQLREELSKESLAVLSRDQQEQFEKMKGEKVDVDTALRRGREFGRRARTLSERKQSNK